MVQNHAKLGETSISSCSARRSCLEISYFGVNNPPPPRRSECNHSSPTSHLLHSLYIILYKECNKCDVGLLWCNLVYFLANTSSVIARHSHVTIYLLVYMAKLLQLPPIQLTTVQTNQIALILSRT